MYHLRDYQEDLVAEVRGEYAKGALSVCMVLSTGGGKTVIFNYITDGAIKKQRTVLVIAHRRKLLKQASKDVTIPFNLIMPKEAFDPSKALNFATVQTLSRRLDTIEMDPHLIIVDEGHLGVSNSYDKIYKRWPLAKILVVTATPERTDGKGLKQICDAMVIGISMKELIARGYLVKTRVFAPQVVDTSGVPTVAGDYDHGKVAELMEDPVVTGNILAHYHMLAADRVTIAFCNTVKESMRLADQFRAAGIRAESLDANDDDEYKDAVLEKLQRREIDIVFNCQLYIEGLDIPEISCVMDMAATQSVTRYLQKGGRGMRPFPNKLDNLYIDFTANWLRHGLFSDDREWSLEGRVKRTPQQQADMELSIRQCPKCYSVFESTKICPDCKTVIPIKERKIKTKDGWLTEVEIHNLNLKKREDKIKIWKCKTLEDFERVAIELGYNKKWAYIKYKISQKKRK